MNLREPSTTIAPRARARERERETPFTTLHPSHLADQARLDARRILDRVAQRILTERMAAK